MVLSKYLSLCACKYPFYSAYKSLIHQVNFGQFKLSTDIEKNPEPSGYVDATKTIHAPYCQGNVVGGGRKGGTNTAIPHMVAREYRNTASKFSQIPKPQLQMGKS